MDGEGGNWSSPTDGVEDCSWAVADAVNWSCSMSSAGIIFSLPVFECWFPLSDRVRPDVERCRRGIELPDGDFPVGPEPVRLDSVCLSLWQWSSNSLEASRMLCSTASKVDRSLSSRSSVRRCSASRSSSSAPSSAASCPFSMRAAETAAAVPPLLRELGTLDAERLFFESAVGKEW